MPEAILNPSSNFTIRRAAISDAEAIATININSWKTIYKNIINQDFLDSLEIQQRIPSAIKRIERNDLDCLVAVDQSSCEIVGFADFGPCRDKNIDADSELYAIYLDEAFKKIGIGKSLFAKGYVLSKNRGYTGMMVSVFDQNINAKVFYEKMGGHLFCLTQLELGGVRYPTANYIWNF